MKYRTVVADPPWPFQWRGGTGGRRRSRTTLGYETVSVNDIRRLELGEGYPVKECVDHDATLYLWVTQDVLHSGEGQRIAQAWGFRVRVGEFIWRKRNFGAGIFPRIGHETCVIYKRGKGSLRLDAAPRNVHSVQEWAQDYTNNGGKKHSRKPDGLLDLIETAHEGPYLEMFARRARFGWDYWGDESLGTADMPEVAV